MASNTPVLTTLPATRDTADRLRNYARRHGYKIAPLVDRIIAKGVDEAERRDAATASPSLAGADAAEVTPATRQPDPTATTD